VFARSLSGSRAVSGNLEFGDAEFQIAILVYDVTNEVIVREYP
jgi:hypothetical protein